MIKKILRKANNTQNLAAETSPAFPSQHPEIEYHLDITSPGLITGWICRKHDESFKSCALSMRINGSDILNFSQNLPRADLAEAGFGDGNHGFEASTNWKDFEVGTNQLEMTIDESITIVAEFEISQKTLMVAMSDHICKHVDNSLLQVSRNLLNDLGPKE